MTHQIAQVEPNADERTPDRDQRIRALRLAGGDLARVEHAWSLWQQYTPDEDEARDDR